MGKGMLSNKKLVLWIAIGFVAVVYLLGVLWFGFSVTQRRIDDVLPVPYGTPLSGCDYLKKYHLREVPEGDASMWLLQDFLTITFDKEMLLDPECLGRLVSDVASTTRNRRYDRKVVIRIYDNKSKTTEYRLIINP
jgi:hypothetical protein